MANYNLGDDPVSHAAVRYLLILELAALLPVAILAFTPLALLGLCLASLAALLFWGVFAWLYSRYRSHPLVQEKSAHARQAADLHTKIQAEALKVAGAAGTREKLGRAQQDESAAALRSLQEDYIRNGLAQARITDAQIAGVGPKLKERLALHGITNAAWVNPNQLLNVEGFGEAKRQAMLAWRNAVYSRLNHDKPAALPEEQAAAIQQKFEARHASNAAAQREAVAKKQTLEGELATLQPRLRELTPLTFRNHLWHIFAKQQLVAGLMAVTLVVSQVCLLSSASMGALAVSIPTGTPTPTLDVYAMQTATVQAAHRQATQMALAIPSETLAVTLTLTETTAPILPSATETLLPTETNTPLPTNTSAPTHTPKPANTPLPTATSASAALSQELVNLSSPVSPGDYASISVHTNPGASCSIVVYYKSGPSKAQGLSPQVADASGICSWSWKVGTRTTPGTWSISVTTGGVTVKYPFVVQ